MFFLLCFNATILKPRRNHHARAAADVSAATDNEINSALISPRRAGAPLASARDRAEYA